MRAEAMIVAMHLNQEESLLVVDNLVSEARAHTKFHRLIADYKSILN